MTKINTYSWETNPKTNNSAIAKRIFILSLILLFVNVKLQAADINWSSLSPAPSSNDIVVVQAGDKLVFDVANATVKGILVFGTFTVLDTSNRSLQTDWILATMGGDVEIGTDVTPFTNKFTLTLSGAEYRLGTTANTMEYDIANTNKIMTSGTFTGFTTTSSNYSCVMSMGAGSTIDIHTDDNQPTGENKLNWTQLQGTVNPGAASLTFKEATNWKVGDRIVIATTDFDLNQAENFTIISVSNNGTTVGLNTPINYMHYGEVEVETDDEGKIWNIDMRAEVGLLSKDVIIQSDVNYNHTIALKKQTDTYGGNVEAMMGGELRLSGVELAYMGQEGKMGRYPAHWHMLGNVNGNQYFKNLSIHHSFNRGLVAHGTHEGFIENNVLYEHLGHGYFLEDGGEYDNQFLNNLGINARQPDTKARATENSDFENTSNFWGENGSNTFTGNHAAGSEKTGFWFDLAGLNGLSLIDYRNGNTDYVNNREGFMSHLGGKGLFKGNVSHSCADNGLVINHQNLIRGESYIGTDAQPYALNSYWTVTDHITYKNIKGFWVRGIGGNFENIIFAENDEGSRYRYNQLLSNSLFIGRTGNIGDVSSPTWSASEGRSLPPDDGDFLGHQFYDGPSGVDNVHFINFDGPNDFALGESNSVHKSLKHFIKKVTFDNCPVPVQFGYGPIEIKGLIDLDGSLDPPGAVAPLIGGVYHGRLNGARGTNGNDAFYMVQNESIIIPEWGVIRHASDVSMGTIRLRSTTSPQTGQPNTETDWLDIRTYMEISRTTGLDGPDRVVGNSNLQLFYNTEQPAYILRRNYVYTIELTGGVQEYFEMFLSDMPMGESITYVFNTDNSNFHINSDIKIGFRGSELAINETNSYSALQAANQTSVFRDTSNNRLIFKFVAEMKNNWIFAKPKVERDGLDVGGVLLHIHNGNFNSSAACTDPPAKVTNIVSTATCNSIDLIWNAEACANEYQVRRKVFGSPDPTILIATVNVPQYLDADPNLVANTNYLYTIKAVGHGGTSLNQNHTTSTTSCALSLEKERLSALNNIKVYPNPASTYITLDFGKSLFGNVSIELYTIDERKVLSNKIISSTNQSLYNLELQTVKPGLYLMYIIENGNRSLRKLVVE